MRRLSQEEWEENTEKCNGRHFLRTPWLRWLNTCGELHISDGGTGSAASGQSQPTLMEPLPFFIWASGSEDASSSSSSNQGVRLMSLSRLSQDRFTLAVSLGRAIKSYTPRRRSTSWRGLGQRGDPAQSLS